MPGDHDIAALETRVEPDANIGAKERNRCALSRGRPTLGGVGGHKPTSVTKCHIGRIRVGAIRDDLDHGGAARRYPFAIVGRDRHGHPGGAPVEILIDLVERRTAAHDGKRLRRLETVHERPTARASIVVHNHDRDVAHVGARGVSEHGALQDRCNDDNAKEPRVLTKFEELLLHQVQDASHRPVPHSRFRRSAASDRTMAAHTTRATSSGQKASGPTPFNRISRSTIRK